MNMKKRVELALAADEYNILLMDDKFNRITKFEIDMNIFNKFNKYTSVDHYNDKLVYLTDDLIELLEFTGDLNQQKKKILKMADSEKISYVTYTTDEYKEFYNTQSQTALAVLYVDPKDISCHIKKHFLITLRNYKEIGMMANTTGGAKIRTYFITISNIIFCHMMYTRAFKDRELNRLQQETTDLVTRIANMRLDFNNKSGLLDSDKDFNNTLDKIKTQKDVLLHRTKECSP